MSVHAFKQDNVTGSAKWAFTTRRVDHLDVQGLNSEVSGAVSGDLVMCEILEINQHKKLQLANRRYSESYVGDRIVVCLGDRYAPDQFEGRAELDGESADLIAAGGVVGQVEHAHQSMSRPTKVRTLGLLTDAHGKILNISRYALPPSNIPLRLTVIGVVGASMNSGKTTASVSLAHGLARAGYRVAGVKATGTGAFGDYNAMEDAGVPALDFTDAGLPTTYRVPVPNLERCFETLVGTAAARGAEVVVVEFADGIFQRETAAILSSSAIRDRLDGVMFAAPDALSSAGGVAHLESISLSPFAVSGKVTCSPLATKEAYTVTGVPHLSRSELCDPATVVPAVRSVMRAFLVEREDAA